MAFGGNFKFNLNGTLQRGRATVTRHPVIIQHQHSDSDSPSITPTAVGWTLLKSALAAGKEVSDAFPPLKPAFVGICRVLDAVDVSVGL